MDEQSPYDHGQIYLHCGLCLKEWNEDAPGTEGTSPKSYARQQAALTDKGIQIYCTRHEVNIMNLDFQGYKDALLDGSLSGEFANPEVIRTFGSVPRRCAACDQGVDHSHEKRVTH